LRDWGSSLVRTSHCCCPLLLLLLLLLLLVGSHQRRVLNNIGRLWHEVLLL